MGEFVIGLYGETFGKDGLRVTFEIKQVRDFTVVNTIGASEDIGCESNTRLLEILTDFTGRIHKRTWTSITITKV